MPAATDDTVRILRPVPRLDGLDDRLHVLAQARARGARVDDELEPAVHVDVVGQVDLLDVDLVGDQIRGTGAAARRPSAATVTSGSGSRTRRFCALRRPSTVEHTARTSSIAATSSGSAGSSVGARPVGQVHRPLRRSARARSPR